MEGLQSKRNAFFFVLVLGACLLYATTVTLFAPPRNAGNVLPKTDSDTVLKDLAHLKSRERKNVKQKNTTSENHFDGVRSSIPVIKPSSGAALLQIDYSTYSSEDSAILKGRVGTMVQRAKTISEVCQARPSLSHRLSKISLVWDTKHEPSIVWCPVYKVASTTWMRNFLRLAHFNENNPKISKLPKEKQEKRRFSVRYGATHNRVFELYPAPTSAGERARVMEDSVRVMIVRHPFTRLLSAYRDKMTKKNPLPARFKFRELQKTIIDKYRSPSSVDNSTFPSFPEFVQYVIDSTAQFKTPREWNENVKCWLPYWIHCSVCTADYNIVMKLETMKEDEQFLITLSRLEELKGQDSWVHLKGSSSSDLAMEYFRDVTRLQVQQLYERFITDFELFQYDVADYLAVARED